MLRLIKKKFLSMIGAGIKGNFKKKTYISFLNSINKNNSKSFLRNFYFLKNLKFHQHLVDQSEKIGIKRVKLGSYRIKKKLKTFRFITGTGQKKEKVFSRFKRNVIRKFSRKINLKKQSTYVGKVRPYSRFIVKKFRNRVEERKLREKKKSELFFFNEKKLKKEKKKFFKRSQYAKFYEFLIGQPFTKVKDT